LQKLLWPRLKANLVQPGKSKRRFFEIIVNDASAGVRVNLRGREPEGTVAPHTRPTRPSPPSIAEPALRGSRWSRADWPGWRWRAWRSG
jgi:hypothetical protein